MNPDPLYALSDEEERVIRREYEADRPSSWYLGYLYGRGSIAGRSSFRWYLLASFVTGLLLGAAVARVVGL